MEIRKSKEKLRQIVEQNFVILSYRKKYNLPLNDERYMNLTIEEMYTDLMLNLEYEEVAKEIEDRDEDDDEGFEEIDSIKEINKNKKIKLKAGYSKEEIDNWFEVL